MRKRILSSALALCLLLSLLPGAAFADDGTGGAGDGSSTETTPTSQTVAQIDETSYTTFEDALTAANSGNVTIKLLADVQTSTILPCNNVTYDLNGHTLDYTGTTAIKPGEKETLSFIDTSVASETARGGTLKLSGTVPSLYGTNSILNPKKDGTVIAQNIKIDATDSAFFPQGNAAAVKITSCDVTAAVYCVGTNAGKEDNYGVAITLKDSTFTAKNESEANKGDNCPILINVPGTLTMEKCTVTGERQAVLVRAGTATITDCDITLAGTYNDKNNYESEKQWGSGNEVPMAAVVVGSQTNSYKADAICTITDTDITAPTDTNKKPAVYVSSNSKPGSKTDTELKYKSQLTISGNDTAVTGDVVVADGTNDICSSVIIKDSATVNGNITNNSTASAVAVIDGATLTGKATVAAGNTSASIYVEKETEDAESNIVALNTVTAKTYTNLATAISEAAEGDTIRLVKDIPVESGNAALYSAAIVINKPITLDGNEHSISVAENFGNTNIINIEDSGKVTLKNLTVTGTANAESGKDSRHCINIFSSTGTTSKSIVTLENVVTTGGLSGVTIGGSDVTIQGDKTNIAKGTWSAVNLDSKSGANDASLTVEGGTIGLVLIENSTGTKKVSAEINGGTIENVVIPQNTTNATAKVNGGTFSNSVKEYATKNFEVKSTDGKYTYYDDGTEAVKAAGGTGVITGLAPEGKTLTITAPASNGAKITVTKTEGTTVVAPSGYYLTSVTNEDGTITYTVHRRSSSGSGGTTVTNYTLTFNTNGGSSIAKVTKSANTTVDLTSYTPTRAGYTFAGWYSDTSLTQKVTSVKLTGNTTVYAKWEETETPTPDFPFTDVTSSDYYYDAVVWAVEENVTTGDTPTTFAPNLGCTRGQIVTFLWRAAGSPAPKTTVNPFTDVSSSDYYYNAVLWAVEQEITNGTSPTTFSPNDTCTRAHAVTFLYRDAGSPAASGSNPFTDVPAGEYYSAPVLWAVANGVTTGDTPTTFAPNSTCTRGQIVTFLYRAAQ